MAVTIKELNITANVSGSSGTGNEKQVATGGGGGLSKLDKEVIIREAVRRAMEEISYKFGR